MNPSFRKILILMAILIACYFILTCCYQIRTTQAAVLTTFEKPVATVTEPGLHFKFPWPIQTAYIFDLRSNVYESPYREYLVKDGFNVVVRAFACWKIADVNTYKNQVGVTKGDGEKQVANLLSKYMKIILSQNSFSDLVGVNDKLKGIPGVENQLLSAVGSEAKEFYGIEVTLIGFDRLELPEATTEAVFKRMRSERMKKVEKIRSEGESSAKKIRTEADAEKRAIIAKAKAEAVKVRGEADTKAFEYLGVYKQHPDFALFLKKLQALESTMKSKTTIVIDKDTPPFNLLTKEGSQLPTGE